MSSSMYVDVVLQYKKSSWGNDVKSMEEVGLRYHYMQSATLQEPACCSGRTLGLVMAGAAASSRNKLPGGKRSEKKNGPKK